MNTYLDLFLTFAKVGVGTFGGGVAMLPMLEKEIVENKKWVTEEELMDYYAIAQCTPGIIAVNVATFTGKKVKGNIGGVAATLGIVFPSLVIIMLIASVLNEFAELEVVQHAFAGIRVCVCVLVVNSVIKLGKKSIIDVPTLIIFIVVTLASIFLTTAGVSPVVYVILAAVAGIVLQVKKS